MKKKLTHIDEFLKDFTNKEFAFFYHYRLNHFTSTTKNKIEEERKIRDISINEIANFVKNQKTILNDKCPRCQSTHKFEEVERVLIHTDYGSYEKDVYTWMCIVCGYNPEKHKPLNFRMRIYRIFKKYTNSKLV